MKLTNLGKIASLKLVKDISISNISNEKYKNNSKDDCILIFSDSKDDFVKLVNSGLFKYTSYKFIYTFRSFNNQINSTITRINLESYYKEINSKLTQKRMYKKSISEYKGNNIIVDCTNVLDIFKKVSSKKVGNTRVELFTNHIVTNILSKVNSYKNLAVIVPVNGNLTQSDNSISKYLNLNSMKEDDLVQFIYHLLKNDGLVSKFKDLLTTNNIEDVTFVFVNESSKTLFKLSINQFIEKKLKAKTISKIKSFINSSVKGFDDSDLQEIQENEDDEEDKSLNKSTKVVENVVNSLITMVKTSGMKTPDNVDNVLTTDYITNNGKLNSQEIALINNMVDRAIEQQKELENNDEGLSDGETEEDRLINKLQTDELFLKYLKELRDMETMGSSNINIKRKETLKTSQDSLDSTIEDEEGKKLTIGSILNSNYDIEIEKKEILPKNNKNATLYDNTKQNRTSEFDKAYMKNNYNKDILKTFSAFNDDEELPLFIESITKENTSNTMTLKETYTVIYRDTKNVKHKVVVDLPIIIDNKYVYINGSKKLIQKQLITKPIIKTDIDTVQLCSDYNKYFIKRFGQKLSEETELLRKFLTSQNIERFFDKKVNFSVKLGNISQSNIGSNTNIYYSSLSETIFSIMINGWNIEFDYAKLQNMTEKENNTIYDKKLAEIMENVDKTRFHMVGYYDTKEKILIVDKSSNEILVLNSHPSGKDSYRVGSNLNEWLLQQIRLVCNSEGIAFISNLSKPKALIYNRIKISGKQIPLIILLGYQYGLTNVLDRYDVPYVLTSKNKRPDVMKDMTMKIPFKNGNLYFDSKLVRNSLLLSGLLTMNTKEYEIDKFAKGGEPYLTYFQDNFGSRNVAKSLSNNMSLFLDPKTKDILKRLELPTNMLDIMLYANTLLESNDHYNNNYLGNYRLRGTEQVNAILYKILADAYRSYKDTSKNGNPIKVSIPQNLLLKRLVENQTVDEASDLNPSLELEKASSVTWKGVGGVGSDDSFNAQFRAYDRSMVGILGMETPDSSKAGIVRTLSYNPAIVNTLGFLDINSETDGNANLYTIAEMLNPYTSLNADSPRKSAIYRGNLISKFI